MSVVKNSVSFEPEVWEALSEQPNRSRVVNNALKLYFTLENKRAEQEAAWSEEEEKLILAELEHYEKTGESYSYEETFNRKF